MVCTWQVTGSFGQAPVQWFVPQEGMFAILKRLVEQEESLQKKDYRSTLEQLVQEMPLEVSVTLGNAEVPLAQLARLRPGDVLILDQPVSEPLRAAIGEEKHFQVWPGRVGNRQALQVESFPES
jgi:flagellar motor switch protein FliM